MQMVHAQKIEQRRRTIAGSMNRSFQRASSDTSRYLFERIKLAGPTIQHSSPAITVSTLPTKTYFSAAVDVPMPQPSYGVTYNHRPVPHTLVSTSTTPLTYLAQTPQTAAATLSPTTTETPLDDGSINTVGFLKFISIPCRSSI